MTMRLNRVASGAVTWRWPMVVLSALTSFAVTVDHAVALDSWQPETLSGISQLHVRVNKVCQFGASAERLREGIEGYLRRNGLPISSNPTNQRVTPYVSIGIGCGSDARDASLDMSLQVIQSVQLNGQTIQAETYTGGTGFVGRTNATEYTRREPELITQMLNVFISDWKSVR
ncbi:MAG: hypothetical protein WBA43_07170 [Elainellaceae cyanobacterium]